MNASRESDLKSAFDALVKQGANALVVAPDPFFDMARGQIVALAAERRLPAIYHHREYVLDGGLMSYGIWEWHPQACRSSGRTRSNSSSKRRPQANLAFRYRALAALADELIE